MCVAVAAPRERGEGWLGTGVPVPLAAASLADATRSRLWQMPARRRCRQGRDKAV